MKEQKEDISDRELGRCLQENTAAKWFCNFYLMGKISDHNVFSRIHKRIETK